MERFINPEIFLLCMKYPRIDLQGSNREVREYRCFKGNQDAILALVNLEPKRAAHFATTFDDADFKRAFVNTYANHADWHHAAYFMAKDLGVEIARKQEITSEPWEDPSLDMFSRQYHSSACDSRIFMGIRTGRKDQVPMYCRNFRIIKKNLSE